MKLPGRIASRAGARCAALALWCAAAAADPLDEALALVLAESPQIARAEADVQAAEDARGWTVTINAGYQAREYLSADTSGLQGGKSGPNAGLTLRIPLFDNRHEIEATKARAAVAVSRDQVLREFVQAAADLKALAEQQRAEAETAALKLDKLNYFSEQEKAGLIEAPALWPHAEAAKQAEQAARRAALAVDVALETTARKYGGEQWKILRRLLAGYAKPTR
jgi:hypothetical protein